MKIIGLLAIVPLLTQTVAAQSVVGAGTVVHFTGTVDGEHRYRNGVVSFKEVVDGKVTVLESGEWRLQTSHPSCATSTPKQVKRKGNAHHFDCGEVKLILEEDGGRIVTGQLSVRLPMEVDVEGLCMHADPRPGRAGNCWEKSYSRVVRPAWSKRRVIEIEPQL